MAKISERQLRELITAVEELIRRETHERQREYYFIEDVDKDSVRRAVEALRGFAYTSREPITLYLNTPGGNVTDGLAMYDAITQIVSRGIEVSIVVQGMAYSMGSVILQAASPGRRLAFPHSWIMIHEPAKWAGWQSTSSAAQHLDRLKAMQAQIYRILSARSGQPLKQIIKDTKRTDFYLDAERALDYGLIDAIVGREASPVRAARAAGGRRPHLELAPKPAATGAAEQPAAARSAAAAVRVAQEGPEGEPAVGPAVPSPPVGSH